jgi:deoxyribonuclease-4
MSFKNQSAVTACSHHRVGFHASITGGFSHAIAEGEAFGCEVIQIFTKSNRQWHASPIDPKELERYHAAREKSLISTIFGHSGYLINPAADNPDVLQKSRDSLLLELNRSAQLKLPFLVLHPGAAKSQSEEAALKAVIESLEWVFARTDSPTKIALEVTAGSGTVLGSKLEQIAWLLDNAPSTDRLAVCLDTCHLFASGYDFRTAADIEKFLKTFKKLIPWKRVAAVHMNDSQGDLGCRKDRHETLGNGRIGWECFQTIMRHPDFAELPLCMEIPPGGEGRPNDVVALKKLKAARGNKKVEER